MSEINHIKSKKIKESKLKDWYAQEKRCENCGKIMTIYYGSGRFCSEKCARSFASQKRSDEAKARRIEIGKKNLIHDGSTGFSTKKYWTPEKRLEHSKRMKKIMSNPAVKQKISQTSKGRSLTAETKQKISKKAKQAYSEGRNKGWTIRKNQKSYAEKFWERVLENNNIQYESEVKIDKPGFGCYFLDFLLPGNVDLEIDGKQHIYLDRAESDKIRDEYLKSKGYVVYRIPWNNINTEKGKLLMKNKINKFLSWYKSFFI